MFILLSLSTFFSSCGEDDPFMGSQASYDYAIHNGQTVPTAPYQGGHPTDFTAMLMLTELENGMTEITVSLDNTISGATYHIHAHDGADPNTTPNGTPYNESPNSELFAQMATGNGGTVSITQTTSMSYDEIINDYSGFFVIHDPLQSISTTDISTYLVVGAFARPQNNSTFASASFSYDFNGGQLVEAFAYLGLHPSTLSAWIQVDELADDRSRITVRLDNTLDGEMYHTHAHDMADPSTTPNGTPYIESPNADVYATHIMGNGGLAFDSQISSMSYDEITQNYDGFFVVHDPLQAITTVDPTTYIILGVFAR